MPIKDRTSLLKEDAEEKLVAPLYERPVTSQEITVIAGGPKNRVEYKLVENIIEHLSNHYPLYEHYEGCYKILTDKDIEDYRQTLKNMPKAMRRRNQNGRDVLA